MNLSNVFLVQLPNFSLSFSLLFQWLQLLLFIIIIIIIIIIICNVRYTVAHCATSRKVAISIPDGAILIFHWHNPSGRTMSLGLTQPLKEMSTRNISQWGEGVKATGA